MTAMRPNRSPIWLWIALLLAATPAWAMGSGFYQGKSEGWYWYENAGDLPIKATPRARKLEPPKTAQGGSQGKESGEKGGGGPQPGSAKWIRKKFPELRYKALDNPSQENIKTYVMVRRLMMDKAERFAKALKEYQKKTPILSTSWRRPAGTLGHRSSKKRYKSARKGIFQSLGSRAGLVVWYRGDCRPCKQQLTPLGLMRERYPDLPIALASLDGSPPPESPYDWEWFDARKRYPEKVDQVERLPAIWLVAPNQKPTTAPVSHRLTDLEDIRQGIVDAAGKLGVIDKTTWRQAQRVMPGYLLPPQPEVDRNTNPEDLADKLKRLLETNNAQMSP